MITKSCKFVEASEVFKGCPRAWEIFVEGDPSCTWGDNNRSMVTPDVISTFFQNADYNENEIGQVETVIKRLDSIEDHTYVDLEN